MRIFPAYAANFQLYPKDGEVARHLAPLFAKLQRIDFTLRVNDPGVNQGQMASDFDAALERAFLAHPRKRRLSLMLNVDFEECDDPTQRAEDATWAFILNASESGGVIYSLEAPSQIAAAMHIVRQAYAKKSE